jgi:hypothetical protein
MLLTIGESISDERRNCWRVSGIPEHIILGVCEFPIKPFPELVEQLDRFYAYWIVSDANANRVEKAWRTLAKAAVSEKRLMSLYWGLPMVIDNLEDSPETDPVEIQRIKIEYPELSKHATALITFLENQDEFEMLDNVSYYTGNKSGDSFTDLRKKRSTILKGLKCLNEVFNTVDIASCIETQHVNSPNAEIQHHIGKVARLNRYLVCPKHAAIALVASISCPEFPITADRVRKAWDSRQIHKKNHKFFSA